MIDTATLIDAKVQEFKSRPPGDDWAACATVWARTIMLASGGWARWPEWLTTTQDGFVEATNVAMGRGNAARRERILAVIGAFEIEDDGSSEWQYVMDSLSMLSAALKQDGEGAPLRDTLTWYIDGTFNVLANDLATAVGHPVRQTEAEDAIDRDATWSRTIAFVQSL